MAVVFAYLGLGMWAIILPTVLVYPIWIIIHLKNCSWRPTAPFRLYRWQEITGFAAHILGVELLNKLRANLDYLLVGHFIGIEALGIYYFAFNAGIGMSLSVINAFTWSIFPHLCAVKDNIKELRLRYFNAMLKIAVMILPLITFQSALAPFYVPIIYGQKWIIAIPILILVCLSALPRPFADAASMLLQTVDKTSINLYWNLIFTVILATSLLIAVNWGIFWVAATVLIAHLICLPIFSVLTSNYVFKKYS
jgi:PST family polysaccharide transporter